MLVGRAIKFFRERPDRYQCAPKSLRSNSNRSQRSNSVDPRLGYSHEEVVLAQAMFAIQMKRRVSPHEALEQTSDRMCQKCGKRPTQADDALAFIRLLTIDDFYETDSSDDESNASSPFDRVRSGRDALPSSSRSDTAPPARRGRFYTEQSSSSRRDRSRGQYSSRSRRHSRNTSTGETDNLPRSTQEFTTFSSQHGRSRSDFSSSTWREPPQRRSLPEPRERYNIRADQPQSPNAESMPDLSFQFASSNQPESVRAQLRDQRWTPNLANCRTVRREPAETVEERQRAAHTSTRRHGTSSAS